MAVKESTRKPLSKRVRFEVFKRDGFRCYYCGAHPPDVLLEVDHIVPVVDGGENDEANLVSACFDCNRGKGGVPLSAVPTGLRERADDVAEREEQLAGYRAVMDARAERLKQDMWDVAFVLFSDGKQADGTLSVRRDWLLSIKRFNERLDLHEVVDAAEKAYATKPYSHSTRFKYFCGICWNKIKAGSNG